MKNAFRGETHLLQLSVEDDQRNGNTGNVGEQGEVGLQVEPRLRPVGQPSLRLVIVNLLRCNNLINEKRNEIFRKQHPRGVKLNLIMIHYTASLYIVPVPPSPLVQ